MDCCRILQGSGAEPTVGSRGSSLMLRAALGAAGAAGRSTCCLNAGLKNIIIRKKTLS